MSIYNFSRREKKIWAVFAEWQFPRTRYLSHLGNIRAHSAAAAERKMMEKHWGAYHFEVAPNVTPTAVPQGSAEHMRWRDKVKNQFQEKMVRRRLAIVSNSRL